MQITDGGIDIIAKYLISLRKLNLTKCCNISDQGRGMGRVIPLYLYSFSLLVLFLFLISRYRYVVYILQTVGLDTLYRLNTLEQLGLGKGIKVPRLHRQTSSTLGFL